MSLRQYAFKEYSNGLRKLKETNQNYSWVMLKRWSHCRKNYNGNENETESEISPLQVTFDTINVGLYWNARTTRALKTRYAHILVFLLVNSPGMGEYTTCARLMRAYRIFYLLHPRVTSIYDVVHAECWLVQI